MFRPKPSLLAHASQPLNSTSTSASHDYEKMDSSVPPIVRGEFLYRDVLLVDVGGDSKRHARAAEADIRQLLNGKAKDEVGHWWTAQCIHYGLPRTNDKNAAKVRLQQALNQGKLKSAPPHLIDMEAQMKKEYASALRKAKSQAKSPAQPGATKGKKRALEEEDAHSSKKTKISLTVDGVSISIDQSVSNSSKKQKVTKSDVSTPKADGPAKTKPATASSRKATATLQKKSQASKGWSGDPLDDPENVFQRSKSQQDGQTTTTKPKKARTETATKEAVKKEPIKETPVKKEATKKESAKKEIIKKEPVKKEPKSKPEPQLDPEPQYDNGDEMDTRPDMSQSQLNVTGVYVISCPQLAEQAPDHADKFRLFLCVDNEGGRIWGGFELAWKSGLIKIDDIAWSTQMSFGWRATDYEANGRLRFGTGCHGDIQLGPGQQVRGIFYNLFPEPLHFEGMRRAGPLWCGKSAWKFQQEWDQYPRDAYGR